SYAPEVGLEVGTAWQSKSEHAGSVCVIDAHAVHAGTRSEPFVDGDALTHPERTLVEHRARLSLSTCLEAVGAFVRDRDGDGSAPHLTSEAHRHVLACDGAAAGIDGRVLLVDDDRRL